MSPSGPLAGLRVADFSRVLAGPYATMMLGDLGAEVIKVERPPHGDDTRTWGPPHSPDGTATYFQSVNRNKTTAWWDLTVPEDRAAALDLVLSSDILVENFAPGTMARFGLDHLSVAALNPGIIYTSITGFGPAAGATMPGYDLLVQAMGGLMSITGPSPDQPTKVGVALVDVLTGLHATVGILAALAERTRTGQGQAVSVNLLSSTLSALVNQVQGVIGAGAVPHAMGNAHPSIAPYETLATADGTLALAVGNDRQFAALCDVLGLDLADTDDYATNPARVAHREQLVAELAAVLRQRPSTHWVERLGAAGVPAGPVNDIPAALALAEQLGLAPIVHAGGSDGGTSGVANPITLSRTPVDYRLPAPRAFTKDADG
jgi:crotonobetainyl-CoA:carnitine CoA-transferase CaiB-like acyl-CoA transferase